jgi:hypothetical protein
LKAESFSISIGLSEHAFDLLVLAFHQGDGSKDVGLVGLHNEAVLDHFINQEVHL